MDTNFVKRAGNRALQVNPSNADIHLGQWGSNWAWTVFSLMLLSTLTLLIYTTTIPRDNRTIHHLLTSILAISSISWFAMASNLGSTPIMVEFLRNNPLSPGIDGIDGIGGIGGVRGYPTRQIFYSRYIDWVLTTPLVLLCLLLLTRLPLSTMFITIVFSLIAVVCGLLGALTRSRYKWGFFVFGCFALVYVLFHIFASGLHSARKLGSAFGRAFLAGSIVVAVVWPMYPLCWALSEGANVIGVSSEFLWYGLLDLVSKPVFGLVLVAMLRWNFDELRQGSGMLSKEEEKDPENDVRTRMGDSREGLRPQPVHVDVEPPTHPTMASPGVVPTAGIPQTTMLQVPPG